MIVRPLFFSASANGPLALVVLTNTMRWFGMRSSSAAKSSALMSGPGMLNIGVLFTELPWPMRSTKTSSPALLFAMTSVNAFVMFSLDDRIALCAASFSGISARYVMSASGIPAFFIASITWSDHLWYCAE